VSIPSKAVLTELRLNSSAKASEARCSGCIFFDIDTGDTGKRLDLDLEAGSDVKDENITIVLRPSASSSNQRIPIASLKVRSARTCTVVESRSDNSKTTFPANSGNSDSVKGSTSASLTLPGRGLLAGSTASGRMLSLGASGSTIGEGLPDDLRAEIPNECLEPTYYEGSTECQSILEDL